MSRTVCWECKGQYDEEIVHEGRIKREPGSRLTSTCTDCGEILSDRDRYVSVEE